MSNASINRISSFFDHKNFADRMIENIKEIVNEGIARNTPLSMKKVTSNIPDMKGRPCKGLIWNVGHFIKWKVLKF